MAVRAPAGCVGGAVPRRALAGARHSGAAWRTSHWALGYRGRDRHFALAEAGSMLDDSAIEAREAPNTRDGSAIEAWEAPNKQDGSAILRWEIGLWPRSGAILAPALRDQDDPSPIRSSLRGPSLGRALPGDSRATPPPSGSRTATRSRHGRGGIKETFGGRNRVAVRAPAWCVGGVVMARHCLELLCQTRSPRWMRKLL